MEEAHFTHCSQQRDQLYNLKHYQSFIFFTLKNFCLCFCNFFGNPAFPSTRINLHYSNERIHIAQLQYDHFERTHLYLFIKSRDINPLKIWKIVCGDCLASVCLGPSSCGSQAIKMWAKQWPLLEIEQKKVYMYCIFCTVQIIAQYLFKRVGGFVLPIFAVL